MEKSHRGILAALSMRKGGLLEGGLRIGVKNGKIFFPEIVSGMAGGEGRILDFSSSSKNTVESN